MKTIVVPTDFSTSADNALHYAIELALQQKSKIILLHSLRWIMPVCCIHW